MSNYFFLPFTAFITAPPIFLSRPCLVIGIPVALLTFCFIALIPTALFSENDNPGIFIYCYNLLLNGLQNVSDERKTILKFREYCILTTLMRVVISASDIAYRDIQPPHLELHDISLAAFHHFIAIFTQKVLWNEVLFT